MSTFVARKSGQNKFKISEIVDWVDGKPKTKSVPKTSWHALGFRLDMTLEEAKAQAKHLNKTRQNEAKKLSNIGRRVEDIARVKSIYLPEALVLEFTQWLADNKVHGDSKKEKIFSHWELAQKLIAEAELFPKDFYLNANKLLGFFVKNKYSLSYARKIIVVLNLWGTFYSSKKSIPFYPIRSLDASMVGEIERGYEDSERFVGASEALTPKMLMTKKNDFKDEQFKWLYCTVWLGLRPGEINQRNQKKRKFEVYYDETAQVDVLKIFQPKLKNKPGSAWKYIPLFIPEMKQAASFLNDDLKQPTLKKMRSVFGEGVTFYGGRKGFVTLMCNVFQQELNQVSNWLGHTDIYRTKKSYEDRAKVIVREFKKTD